MKRSICIWMLWIGFALGLKAQPVNKLTRSEKKNGWVLLFDGLSTEGWSATSGQPVPAGWKVENGMLTTVAGGKGGDIITLKDYADFDLKLDYMIDTACNSGVKYFFTKYESGGNLGMEYQILDDKLAEDNKEADHLAGSLYDVLPPVKLRKKVYPPGKWNSIRIVSNGNNIEHWLNDFKILEYTRGSKKFTDAVAQSKFSKAVPGFGMVKKGRILLQEHGGVVRFRNIRIKAL